MILATKKVEIEVKLVQFMRIVLSRCFFPFSLPEEADLTTIMVLGSRVISVF